MSNGKKILFKNLLTGQSDYIEIETMHSPKEMLRLIGKTSAYGALPKLKKRSLRDCQFSAENKFEEHLREGKRKISLYLQQEVVKPFLLVSQATAY